MSHAEVTVIEALEFAAQTLRQQADTTTCKGERADKISKATQYEGIRHELIQTDLFVATWEEIENWDGLWGEC